MRKIAVLAPLSLEFEAIAAALGEFSEKQSVSINKHSGFRFPDLGIHLFVGGHGKVQFAVQTQSVLHQIPEIEAVICAGCAGSLSDSVRVSDVVVAERTTEHDFRLQFVRRPPPIFEADADLLADLRKVRGEFSIHFGTVASGDEDVIDPARAAEIARVTGALAVAWEGAGGARVCKFLGVPYVEIRGVTDSANGNAISDFKANLRLAMVNVAKVIRQLQTLG